MSNSWKKYGGIYKSDRYNSIGVGTMVADQVLIRQRVISSSQVEGSLIVGENVSVGLDLSVKGSTSVSGELFANSNSYFGDKLYFNKSIDTYNNYISFLYGDSKAGRLGIGTTTPTSFVDINVSDASGSSGIGGSAVGNEVINVLTVRNSNNQIRNIIAQNVHKSGIVADTIGNIASIGFYIGNVDVSSAIPPIYVSADTSNNIFTISSENNRLISTNNTTVSSTNDTIILSNKDLSINTFANTRLDTSNNLTITTGNVSTINSIVSLSKRSGNIPLLNGTITIYDNSAAVFLTDYYQQSTVKAGNAVTIVSADISSTAFINIVTPNKNGFSIGGGAYPRDISRTMGTIGLTPTDASYLPTHVMVTNKNIDKHKISVGINTYSPESNKYTMDINGPTRVGNGELHIKYYSDFQQSSVHFSKTNPNFGVIVGSPYYQELATSPFEYKFLTTSDGGVTWRVSTDFLVTSGGIDGSLFKTTANYDILDAYTLNDNEFFFIGTINSARLGYTNVSSSVRISVDIDTNKFQTIYALNDISYYKVLIGGSNVNGSRIYYSNHTDPKSVVDGLTTDLTSIDASCTDIKHCDGSGNIAYFVGNGIEKINYSSTPPISVSYKSDGYYNKVYVYDASYAVAVGENASVKVISYTHNGGTNWTDVNINNINTSTTDYANYSVIGTTVSIKKIVLVDSLNGIATGSFKDGSNKTYPLILCTKDGSVTWNRIDPKVFYSSGVGHYIESNQLSCIVPSSTDNYVIVNNTLNSSTDPFVAGSSSIIYGYLPNIFNVFSNQVMDVNGGMNVDGKIWQF